MIALTHHSESINPKHNLEAAPEYHRLTQYPTQLNASKELCSTESTQLKYSERHA